MLQQSAEQQQYPGDQLARKLAHPRRLDIFLHGFKTARLIKALMVDSRVSVFKKVLFVGSIAAIVVILLFPDAINETILSTVLPLVGTVLGVPLDAGFDWIAFTLVAVNLLRYFPSDIVAEHYSRIFNK
ncbi:hypothetical protein [Dictyobacter aurantiacus]|uniref:DUF1232 domain-containing protein n=1 Tax=Dictyobacter aurantiacus TaxID=1936993 RepID=A0A401ZDJ3_9CHLR|nr:hypothetical protein [Dictyobacter aurantiacus]GCE04954.1 hypothetical protein KDAU_22830 [Dictyobacter aurantiacus]